MSMVIRNLLTKGNPLYYFGEDTNRGENKGVSVPTPGVWPVASLQTTEALEQANDQAKQ
jgi:hypothetical protein